MTEAWYITFLNEVDAEFGGEWGETTYMLGLDKAVAKAIARHKNKTTPDFITYYAKEEPKRYC